MEKTTETTETSKDSRKKITINKKHEYYVNENEFNLVYNQEFNNLRILDKLGEMERIISLLKELSTFLSSVQKTDEKASLIALNQTHGGFIPISCSPYFSTIDVIFNGDLINSESLIYNPLYDYSKTKQNVIDNIKLQNTYTQNINNINIPDNYLNELLDTVVFPKLLNKNSTVFFSPDEDDDLSFLSIFSNKFSNEKLNDFSNIFLVRNIKFFKQINSLIKSKGLNSTTNKPFFTIYHLTETDYYLCIPQQILSLFEKNFFYYIKDYVSIVSDASGVSDYDKIYIKHETEENIRYTIIEDTKYHYEFNYDNLLHLCIMVKDAGPQFENMLIENMPFVDRWTIMDTGSTDETLDIIKRVLVNKRGQLFHEPFVNFKVSRNRCLELTGKECKFIVILDDTYVLKGKLRDFLKTVRGDQYSDSFSMYIQSNDVQYVSNRIIKSDSGLRYIHRIHEVINSENNINVIVPNIHATILDGRFDYMEKRTMERKKLDLKLLFEELEEDPMEPRTYYYLGQTYNLIENYELAYKYFLKRSEFTNSGFIQERIDAVFEAARLANFKLNLPWEVSLQLYEQCFKIDESRSEPLYFIGIHYYLIGDKKNRKISYDYFKRAFIIGFPIHSQYGLKPDLNFHFLPKFLARLCYEMEDFEYGQKSTELFLEKNEPSAADYAEMVSYNDIFRILNLSNINITNKVKKAPIMPDKPIFCFVSPGGFQKWSGKDILLNGVGGSETYIIEMSRYIQRIGHFQVYVFCDCLDNETFEGVKYIPISKYPDFVNSYYIEHCIVSRFSEYLPVSFKGWTENVYLVVHDLTPTGIVIPIDNKLKRVFCMTEWHVEYFTNIFPLLKNATVPLYNGVDVKSFDSIGSMYGSGSGSGSGISEKLSDVLADKLNIKPIRFIYSSMANRGLLQLLEMWKYIIYRFPQAIINIYCDLDNSYVNSVAKEDIEKIRLIIKEYPTSIIYHGFVNKKTLVKAWKESHIWFYPCVFMETFCITALEAAVSKTLVITNDLAGLKNTVGDRGVVVPGDPTTDEWKNNALGSLFSILESRENKEKIEDLIERNYKWGIEYSWKNQADKLFYNYIFNEKLKYKGEYGLKYLINPVFYETIQYFNETYLKTNNLEYINNKPIHILEIGTYTGISLIHMTKFINNSLGFGIDKWTNYSEEDMHTCGDKEEDLHAFSWKKYIEESKIKDTFYDNIKKEGLKIQGIQGDSNAILLNFIKQIPRKFDFIYVDGSKDQMVHYTDLFLSWQILNQGGIVFVKKPHVYGCYEKNNAVKRFIESCFLDNTKNNRKQFIENNLRETDSLIFFKKE
jgi:hypothetical protein